MSQLSLCVIAPFLQGDYMGEIINQLRILCAARDYQFTVIRTDSFGEFSHSIGASDYDGVITIRNAASPKLVENLQHRGLPVVAIAHDYFPLDVPFISTDNARGLDLGYDYLRERGHKRLAFVGDLSQYDLRKRYERFCDRLESDGIASDESNLVCVDDTLFTGGMEAASEFRRRELKATGVICGAGHTGMGFVRQLAAAGIEVPKQVEVVSFDGIPIMQLLTPDMPHIDQNLNILAQRSLETLETLITEEVLANKAVSVEPTLVDPGATGAGQAVTSPPPDSAMANPAYVNSITSNSFELTHRIIDSDLDSLMSLSPLFGQHMSLACVSKLVMGKFNRTRLKILKVFENNMTGVTRLDSEEFTVPLETFPGKLFKSQYDTERPTLVHFPIVSGGATWGFLSVWGRKNAADYATSFSGFTAYLDNICYGYSLKLDIERKEQNDETVADEDTRMVANHGHHHIYPSFEWDLNKGHVTWNEQALEKLGFVTDLEKNIYRNMDIFDRVHQDDEQQLRKEITLSLAHLDRMNTVARLKTSQGDFVQFRLEGEVVQHKDQKAIRYRCKISPIN